jgi:hypothetical protein
MHLLLTLALVAATMCGDCNHDGRVTIAELVQAVHNALAGDRDTACGVGCSSGVVACAPGATCTEFPAADVNGTFTQCDQADVCAATTMELQSCVAYFASTDRFGCHAVEP